MYNPITKELVISRDVVLAEHKYWKWCKDGKDVKESVLKWDWDDNEDKKVDNGEGGVNSDEDDKGNNETLPKGLCERKDSPSGRKDSPSGKFQDINYLPSGRSQGRICRKPAWVCDNVTGERFFKDDEVQNLVLYIETRGPNTYEEAIRSSKWKTTMECEIEAIERNKT